MLNKKFFIFLILIVMLIFSIVNCAKEKSQTIDIGVALSLTGFGAVYGKASLEGARLAVEEINKSGGIESRNIELVVQDTESTKKGAVNAVNALIDIYKVPVIIGPTFSTDVHAIKAIANSRKVISISPSATDHLLTDAGPYIFRTIVSDVFDGTANAQFAFNKLKARSAGLLYVESSGPYGVTESFRREFIRLGGKVTTVEKGPEAGTDYRGQLTKIKETNPDVIFFAGQTPETVTILKQAKELNIGKQLLTHQIVDNPDVIQKAGDAAEGVIFTTPKLDASVNYKPFMDFYNKYRAKFNSEPQNFASNGFDAVMVVAKSIAKYGYTSDGIRKGLHEVKDYQAASGIMSIDENGDVIQEMRIMTIKNGKVIPYEK